MVEILKVDNKKDVERFIDFPHDLYADDPNYVPELKLAQRGLLDKAKHPFFKHSDADFFLAMDNGKILGRVAAIRNNNYVKFTQKNIGFFGFFEAVDNYEVARSLLDTACKWVKEQGFDHIMGPENYSTNETCGTLIEGFDSPPVIMMTYNKPYYAEFLEKYGFGKEMDLLAYQFIHKNRPEKLDRLSKLVLERLNNQGITIRKIDLKKFDEEVDSIQKVYNAAWEKNWGFVPMTYEEIKYTAKDLKSIIDPDFVLLAEHEGEIVGYSLIIPDFNQVLIKLKRGRLFPWGIFKLLYYKNKINGVRIITLGLLEKYRKLGIDAYFYTQVFEEGLKKGMIKGEASWILENNEMMNRAILNTNGTLYKKYRIYKKAL